MNFLRLTFFGFFKTFSEFFINKKNQRKGANSVRDLGDADVVALPRVSASKPIGSAQTHAGSYVACRLSGVWDYVAYWALEHSGLEDREREREREAFWPK